MGPAALAPGRGSESRTSPRSERVAPRGAYSNRRSILAVAEYDFPQDLRDAQLRLHQVSAAYQALRRALAWSVDPAPGWAAGEKQPYTGYQSVKTDSPGYTEHEKSELARLRADFLELSTVSTHPYWATLARGTVVEGRTALKQTVPSAIDEVAAAPDAGIPRHDAARAA